MLFRKTAGVCQLNRLRGVSRVLVPVAAAVALSMVCPGLASAQPSSAGAAAVGSGAGGLAGQQSSPPAQVLQSSQAVAFGSQMQVFGRVSGGSVSSDVYTPSAASWSGWQGLGGDLTTNPAAVQYGTQMQVFGLDSSGNTEQDVWSGSSQQWSGWHNLGGPLSDAPVAVEYNTSQYGDQMEVYGLASNGQAYSDVWSPGSGTWSGWYSLGGSNLVGEPSAVVYGQQLQVFARNTSGTVYSDVYTASTGKWSGWQSLGGTISTSPMAAQYQTSQSGDQLEVYGLASNGQAYGNAYTPSTSKWSGWIALGGSGLAGGVFPVQYGIQMELFTRNTSGTVYSDVYTPTAGTWSGWRSVGGTVTSNPVAVEYDSPAYGDQLEVFGQAGNGQTYSDVWTPGNSTWSGWYSMGEGTPAGTGPVPNATLLKFPVSDKVSLQVNVGSGDALVTTSDLSLPQVSGSLSLGVAYNSLLTGPGVTQGADGYGWRQREGTDVRLYPGPAGSVTYAGEDGTAGIFTAPPAGGSTYGSPSVFHATLSSSPGSACGGSAYQLTWHATGEAMCFNSSGTLTSQADRNGNTTTYSYNGGGQETQIAYTPAGLSSPAETVTATWTGSYLTGLSQSGGSAGTKTISYGVNASGDLTSVKQADGTTITLGYDGSHDLTSIKTGAGDTTTLGYNPNGQVTSVSQPYGASNATATTRLSYVSATETQVADPDTNQAQAVSAVPATTYTINSQDLVTKTVDQQGNTRSTSYTSFNDIATATNGENGTTTGTYNPGVNNGQSLTASQSATGATSSLAYGNSNTGTNPTAEYQPSSSTDAQSHKTAYTYDGAGNLLQSADALPATAKVTYNNDGTPSTSTDPMNGTNSTSYAYSSLHQLTKVTPPTGNMLKPETLTYDGFGRVATITDGDGNTVTYTYDNADRITKQAYTGGAQTLTVSYAYDGAGNLKTQTDPSGTTSYTYDGRNMVLTKTATSGGGTLTYNYDADGNLILAKDAGGSTSYTYDTRNLLASLKDPAGNLWQFAYNADGLRTTTWFATNAGNTSWAQEMVTSYDKGDRISRIRVYRASSTANVVSDTSYCYSPYVSGQPCPTSSATTDKALLQWSQNNQTSAVSQYTYDTGGRLTSVTNDGGKTYSYGYDSDGNLTSGADQGIQTFNSANQSTVSGFTYDGAGNLTAAPGDGTLTYNDAGQWTGASNAGGNGAESFTYAGAGQNQVLSDGSATGITYGLAGQAGQPWVQSYSPVGSATNYVIHDQQGTPLGYVQSGTSYAFATDNLGSVTNVIAGNGTTVATYAYDPYGHMNSVTGADSNQNLLRFTGALYDSSSNYWHFGARWYNAYTSNFTTQDTNRYLSDPVDGNRYAYAADNPANYTDPTGLSFWGGVLDFFVQLGKSVNTCITGAAALYGATVYYQAEISAAGPEGEGVVGVIGCASALATSDLGVNGLTGSPSPSS